jgi:predicted enzyme related to lactoylglutathione lyase
MFASSGLDSASRALPDEAGAYVIAVRVYQRDRVVTNYGARIRSSKPVEVLLHRSVSLCKALEDHSTDHGCPVLGKGAMMKLNSMYPVLLTDDVAGCSGFFVEHMGFEERFKSDWYVSLVHGGNNAYELAIILHDHETIPGGLRQPTSTLLLNFEVPSVQSEYDRLTAEGVEVLQPMQDLPAGQRHFICSAPGGVLVDVIEVVPPSEEYADNYVS